MKYEEYKDLLIVGREEDLSKIGKVGMEKYKVVLVKGRVKEGSRRDPGHKEVKVPCGLQREEFFTEVKQVGVYYQWNPFFTMFCRGNITEKLRMAKISCAGEVVVDLFSGIGYWSLLLSKHSTPSHVYCCDINRYSLIGLEMGIRRNKLERSKFTLLYGDNRENVEAYRGKGDRVIMGYLPSPFSMIDCAVEGLRREGGVIHYHSNSSREKVGECLDMVVDRLRDSYWSVECIGMGEVKSYAPGVFHYVFDLRVKERRREGEGREEKEK